MSRGREDGRVICPPPYPANNAWNKGAGHRGSGEAGPGLLRVRATPPAAGADSKPLGSGLRCFPPHTFLPVWVEGPLTSQLCVSGAGVHVHESGSFLDLGAGERGTARKGRKERP